MNKFVPDVQNMHLSLLKDILHAVEASFFVQGIPLLKDILHAVEASFLVQGIWV